MKFANLYLIFAHAIFIAVGSVKDDSCPFSANTRISSTVESD